MTTIGSNAFSNKNLSSVTIPDSVTSIGRNTFAGNNLNETDVTLGTGFDHYWLYNTSDPTKLEGHILGGNNGVLVVPDGVTAISTDAFSDNQLTSVIIPEGVVDIYDGVFYNNKLTSITLPTTLKTLRYGRGGGALENNQLTSITILSPDVIIGQSILTNNELFKNAYLASGPGTYIGTQTGTWKKQ